jgi:hypothetical protein
MPEKQNGVLKKNGHSYRLHGEEKSSASIAHRVRWRAKAALISKTVPVTSVEDELKRRMMYT